MSDQPVQDTAPQPEKPLTESIVVPEIPVVDVPMLVEDQPADPTPAKVPDEVAAPVVPVTGHGHRAVLEIPINAADKLTSADTITLPSKDEEKIREMLEHMPNIDVTDNKQGRNWAATLQASLSVAPYGGMFNESFKKPDSEYKQYVQFGGIKLAGSSPRFPEVQNKELTGSGAIARVLSHLGLGQLFSAPMWHSGFWVTFKPPTESAMVEHNRLIASDKIEMGRYSYGMAFSNLTSYTVERLLNFAADHIHESSIRPEDLGADSILKYLKAQDIPAFLWGFLCSIYPRGFNYRRPCCNDAEKCNHVALETLNLKVLQWTDGNALTDWQKQHMSKRSRGNMEVASISRYQEEMKSLYPMTKVVSQNQGAEISYKIKTPTALEYVNAGHRWISSMVEMVERVVGVDISTTERDTLLKEHGKASLLCQFSHWVESLEMGSNTILDQTTVETLLAQLSSDDELREGILKGITDYIDNSMISIIGIPVYECPVCGKDQGEEETPKRFKEVIPLDTNQVFFLLVNQRIARLRTR